MIEKMKFLSITGPKKDIDRVIDQYLCKYDIHLENALSELKAVKDLRPYIEVNPYKALYTRAQELSSAFPTMDPIVGKTISIEQAIETVETLDKKVSELTEQKQKLDEQLIHIKASLDKIEPFTELDYDLSSILHFSYIRFRFGRVAHEYYDKFEQYIYDSLDTVLYKCHEDSDYVWAVYFVPRSQSDRIDAIYQSMHFERFFIPDEYNGTANDAVTSLRNSITGINHQINQIQASIAQTLSDQKIKLQLSTAKLASLTTNFNVRKLAACTNQEHNTFYIICGWMTVKDASAFQKEILDDFKLYCILEDDHNNIISAPPTKLKNPKLFKPFEMFIQMYGLPAYNEFDPTMLVAITYSLLFGFMFGDVGQGLCLLVGGALIYKYKKMNLGAIVSCAGFFSTIFGFMFGSVFGFEHFIEPLWLRPATHMTKLPFIGNLNTVFVIAIAIGMGIILLTMVLNIINSLRAHDLEGAYFETNGMAGLVFYAALVTTVVLFMTGNTLPGGIVLMIMFLLPLLVIFFKEPLTAFIEKKAEIMPKEKGMFVVQGFFELFEVLLSYFSNTLSFVRVGAFAVSHAAMMEVVLMLAGAEAGNPNWIVIILGNLFVCGMEGLIVGIQVLRLEYYELFSRFYKGNGREFKPYGKTAEK